MSTLKKRIRDILSPHVIGVTPDTLVEEAIAMMQANRISCVLVLDAEQPVGIFTERNIVEYAAQHGGTIENRTIRELMSAPVIKATIDMYIYEAFNLLIRHNIRHLVIVDIDNRAVGVMTQSTMLGHLGYEYFLEIKKVSKLMTKTVFTLPKTATVYQALTGMAQKTISCVIIAEEGRPVGILTERDIGRLIAAHCDVHQMTVEEVMTSPVKVVQQQSPLYEVAWLMRLNHIRRVVVVDNDGTVAGLTTETDIIKGLEGEYIETLKQIIKEQEKTLEDTSKDLYQKSTYLDNLLRSSLDMGIIATDITFRIAYYNPAAEAILQYRNADVRGRDVRDIPALDQLELSRFKAIIESAQQRERHLFSFERRTGREKIRYIQGAMTGIWDPENRLIGFVVILQDVTEQQKAEQKIQYMAYHDALTNLPNRLLFNERLVLELSHAKRDQEQLALMVIDLDRFKDVNDTLGHHTGDLLLKAVAERLQHLIRKSDTVARVGGDEFILILPRIQDRQQAIALAEKLMRAFEAPFQIETHTLQVTLSIGLALYPVHGSTDETLVQVADRAMYQAKETRRESSASHLSVAPDA